MTRLLVVLLLVAAACNVGKDRGVGNPGPGPTGKKDGGSTDGGEDLAVSDAALGDAALGDAGGDAAVAGGDLKASSGDLAKPDLLGKVGDLLAGSVGGPPKVGQCVTDNDCGGATCNPFFPGGRCQPCALCPNGTTCNSNVGVCTQACSDCGDTLSCGSSGGEEICLNPGCSSQGDCPSIYECRVLEGSSGTSKYCQRWKCGSVGDPSCPSGTDCRKYSGSTYVCVETALF